MESDDFWDDFYDKRMRFFMQRYEDILPEEELDRLYKIFEAVFICGMSYGRLEVFREMMPVGIKLKPTENTD